MSEDDNSAALSRRWARLTALTPARIGLGRSGASLPTREVLRFGLAHAQARDAVHEPFRAADVAEGLARLSLDTIRIESAAPTRQDYLRRPDLGRELSPASRAALSARQAACDLAIIVADGLSSTAVHQNAVPLVATLLPHLQRRHSRLAPVAVASQARVALGDEAAHALGARLALVLIGERPGLSSPDSLGAYLTFAPQPGLTDAARNCVSNIRPGGLPVPQAAIKLAWLIDQAFRRSVTGVELKDESDAALGDAAGQRLPPAQSGPGPDDPNGSSSAKISGGKAGAARSLRRTRLCNGFPC